MSFARTTGVCVAIACAVACSQPTEPHRASAAPGPPPAAAAPAPIVSNAAGSEPEPSVEPPACRTAVELAMEHEGQAGDADWFDAVDDPPDLDGDGRDDIVLVGLGHRNAEHYFFVLRESCAELVGVISASTMMGFACYDTATNGLCDLAIGRLMVHGETEHSTYKFNGTGYEMYGTPELGSRPPKFR